MQTKDLSLTAVIGRPETLKQDHSHPSSGLCFGRITYVVTRVPVDVPVFEVIRVAQRLLSCRANHHNIYDFAWPTLYSESLR